MEVPGPTDQGPAPCVAPGPRPAGRWSWAGRFGRRLERVLFVAGFVTLAACAVALLDAAVYQFLGSRWLDLARGRGPGSARSARLGEDRPYGRIEIPRLGLSAVIREGVDRHTLLIAVGHVPGTALPGEGGNAVLSGHRDSFFRKLRHVRVDDAVRIVTPDDVYYYRVDGTQVTTPDRTEALAPTRAPTLTLITCYPFNFIGPAPKRFIVRARQVPPPERPVG